MIEVRVEYEITPIRHIAVRCPDCGRWYRGNDITSDPLCYDYQIPLADFYCPMCGKLFGNQYSKPDEDYQITEPGMADEVYKDCLQRKEVWE